MVSQACGAPWRALGWRPIGVRELRRRWATMHAEGGLRIELSATPHWPARPRTKGWCLPFSCPAGEPWHHPDPGLPQRLLEEKEQALAVLQETVKVHAWPSLQAAWTSMWQSGGRPGRAPDRGSPRAHPRDTQKQRESTEGWRPDHPALPVIRHQRPGVRGCRLTGLGTWTYWTAGLRALGPSQGAEGSSLRRKPSSGGVCLFPSR